jgi:hypothetical protein
MNTLLALQTVLADSLTNSDSRNIIKMMVLIAIIWFVAWILTMFVKIEPGRTIIYACAGLGSVLIALKAFGLF